MFMFAGRSSCSLLQAKRVDFVGFGVCAHKVDLYVTEAYVYEG